MKWTIACSALVLIVFGAFAALAAARADEVQRNFSAVSETKTFVGRVTGSRAYIGISLKGNHVIVYVCDGDGPRKRAQSTSEWFRGAVRGQQIALTSRKGARLTARIDGDRVAGTVRLPDGTSLSFVAVAARGKARFLWGAIPFSRSGKLAAGWIRLADRSERGTFVNSNFTCQRMAAELKVRVQEAIDVPLAENRREATELMGRYLEECVV